MHRNRKEERGEHEQKDGGGKTAEMEERKDEESQMTTDGKTVISVAEEESQFPPLPIPPPPEVSPLPNSSRNAVLWLTGHMGAVERRWHACRDGAGNAYYYNEVTGEIQVQKLQQSRSTSIKVGTNLISLPYRGGKVRIILVTLDETFFSQSLHEHGGYLSNFGI